jgi:hypothetical protein
VRRLLLILLGTAVVVSACGSAVNTAAPTPAPTPAQVATQAPTAAPSPTTTPVDAGWTVLAPAGDGFTSRFPGEPKLTTTTQTTQAGATPTSVWEYLANTNLDYNIAMWQYPAGSMAGTAPSDLYDTTITGMATGNGLTLSNQSDITLSGHTGRAFTLIGESYTLTGEVVLVADNLYMVYATYAPTVEAAGPNAFVADFELTA